MAGWGHWKPGQSARVQAAKALKNLTDLGKMEKGDAYRLPGIKSTWTPHNRSLSKAISEILTNYPHSIVFREHSISEVGLRPDALIMVDDGDEVAVIVLEIMHEETEAYFTQKMNTWRHFVLLSALICGYGFSLSRILFSIIITFLSVALIDLRW